MTRSKKNIMIIVLLVVCIALVVAATVTVLVVNRKGNDLTGEKPAQDKPDDPGKEKEEEKTEYVGLFAAKDFVYNLTDDYVLSDEDVTATGGSNGVATLSHVATFNLNGHKLDLNDKTLNIMSDVANDIVTFNNGTITNGHLVISVPNGDIVLSGAVFDESVDYEFEAASETIRFSNAIISGKGTIKSDSNVKIEYSAVQDITLSGKGTLTAGTGSTLGSLTVGENANGASVNVSAEAKVTKVELQSAAKVEVSGAVTEVNVAETVKNSTTEVSVSVLPTAKVDKVELKAAANVSVAGKVSSVKVAETVKNDEKSVQVHIAEGSEVSKVELQAVAAVNVAGKVDAIAVAETATTDTAKEFKVTVAETAEVKQVELEAPVSVEVSGTVNKVSVKDKAEGASVKLNETATVADVIINAENTKIQSENDTVNVYVAETVKTVTANVETISADEARMAELLAHVHVFVITSRTDATCEADGKIIYTCEADGETMEETIPKLGHNWRFAGIVKQATDTEKAVAKYICSNCGETKEETVDEYYSLISDVYNAFVSSFEDGVYTFTFDGDFIMPMISSYTKEVFHTGTINIDHIKATVEIKDSQISGVFDAKIIVKDEYDKETQYYQEHKDSAEDFEITLNVSGKLEGETLYVKYKFEGDVDKTIGHENATGEVYGTVGSVVKAISGAALRGRINFSEIDDIYNELKGYFDFADKEAGESQILKNLIKELIDATFVSETDDDGNTTYVLSKDAVEKFIDKKIIDIIDDVIGKETYDKVIEYVGTLADKTVKEVVDDVLAFVDQKDLDIDEIIDAVLPLLFDKEEVDEFTMNASTKVLALLSIYDSDKTIAELVCEYSDKFEKPEDVKDMVDGFIKKAEGIFEMKVSDIVKYAMEIGDDELSGMLDFVFNFAPSVTVTVDGEGNVVSYDVSFELAMGKDASVSLNIAKKADEDSPKINAELAMAENSVSLVIEKKDGEDKTTVSANGELEDGTTVLLDGALKIEKNSLKSDVNVEVVQQGNEDTKITVDVSASFEKDVEESVDLSSVEIGNKGYLDNFVFKIDTIEPYYYYNNYEDSRESYPLLYRGGKTSFEAFESVRGGYFKYTKTQLAVYGVPAQNEGEDCFYGYVKESVTEGEVSKVNGKPEIMIYETPDCGSWVKLNYAFAPENYNSAGNIVTWGYFTINDGEYDFIAVEREYVGEDTSYYYGVQVITGIVYYNTATGKYAAESQHDYSATYEFLTDSHDCNDGVKITRHCANCGDEYSEEKHYHVFSDDVTYLPSSSAPNASVVARTCDACGRSEVSTYMNFNDYSSEYYMLLTESEFAQSESDYSDAKNGYKSIAEVKNLGFDVEGFYYGYAYCKVDNMDGRVGIDYTWYTHTEDGCFMHHAYVYDYEGNDYYKPYHYVSPESIYEGHHTHSVNLDLTVLEVANVIKEYYGQDIPFAAEEFEAHKNVCEGCGTTTYALYRLYDRYSNEIELNLNYEDGKVYNYRYDVRYEVEDLVKAKEIIGEYADEITATNGFIRYSGDNELGVVCTYVEIWSDEKVYGDESVWDYVSIVFDYNYYYDSQKGHTPVVYEKKIEIYSADKCERKEIVIIYDRNGVEKSKSTNTYKDHLGMNYVTIYGNHPYEEGALVGRRCSVCGFEDLSVRYGYNDYSNWIGSFDGEVIDYNYASYLVKDIDSLEGLKAYVSPSSYVRNYGYLENVEIALTNDWTLNHDVYLKAYGITIDLNGHIIDLNGHNLIVYGYAGSIVTLTDTQVDLTDKENIKSGICNSGEEGYLILFTGAGQIDVGHIFIHESVEDIYNDVDNQSTIFESFAEEKGVELDILKYTPTFDASKYPIYQESENGYYDADHGGEGMPSETAEKPEEFDTSENEPEEDVDPLKDYDLSRWNYEIADGALDGDYPAGTYPSYGGMSGNGENLNGHKEFFQNNELFN